MSDAEKTTGLTIIEMLKEKIEEKKTKENRTNEELSKVERFVIRLTDWKNEEEERWVAFLRGHTNKKIGELPPEASFLFDGLISLVTVAYGATRPIFCAALGGVAKRPKPQQLFQLFQKRI